MNKKRWITWICIIVVIALIIISYITEYITNDYNGWKSRCNEAVIDGRCGMSSCNKDILDTIDCGIVGYFKVNVFKIKPKDYKSRKEECEYVNQRLNCGHYSCSLEGYYFNHNLCFH